jgi:hypothetical protein
VNGRRCLKIEEMKKLLAEFTVGLDSTDHSTMGPYQPLNTEVLLMRHGVIPR